jgi:rhodanese-related sulfurtransferase
MLKIFYMKTWRTISAIAFVLWFATACSIGGNKQEAQTLGPKECKELFDKIQGVFIDLRSAEEFKAGMIEGAMNLDLKKEDFKEKLQGLSKSNAYFVYSENGELNSEALNLLKENGFSKVYELEGGISRWKEEGLPVSEPVEEEVARTERRCVGVKPIVDYRDGKKEYVREVDVSCDTSFQVVTKGHGFMGVGKFASSYAYDQEVQKAKSKKGSKH